MTRKRRESPLKFGTVTFGEREAHLAFADALRPYFAKVEVELPQTEEQPRKRTAPKQAKQERR